MNIEKTLDAIHAKVTKNRLLQIFTSFTRILLVIGFVPPSLKKILNEPFTILPDTHPVGHYFNALYQTGFYYQFLGWAQLFAAILLLFPRTAHLGALLFFPIILNIAVLTSSVGFQGTWLVTILMSLAALYLVCWDYDRLKPVLFLHREKKVAFLKYELIWLPVLFTVGGISGYLFLAYFFLNNIDLIDFAGMSMIGGGCFIFGLIITIHHRFMKIGNLEIKDEML